MEPTVFRIRRRSPSKSQQSPRKMATSPRLGKTQIPKTMKNLKSVYDSGKSPYWFQRHARSVIFVIITLALVGCYLAFTVPVDVFPATNFPRVLIGVDNGVMPIDQMMVTITRPLEEAVNSVPGLLTVRSTTSRGSAEINLFFAGTWTCSRHCSTSTRRFRAFSQNFRIRPR